MKRLRLTALLLILVLAFSVLGPALAQAGSLTIRAAGGDVVWSDWDIIVYPTCTTPGKRVRYSNTGIRQEEVIPAGHSYGSWKTVSAATCIERAKQTRTCQVCGHIQTRHIGDYAPHQWGEWQKTRDPSPELPGLLERACDVCGLTEQEEIPYDSESGPASTSSEISITLEAHAEDPGPYHEGDDIVIQVTVTNTCDQNLHFTTSMPELEEEYPDNLLAHQSWTGTYRTAVTKEDIENSEDNDLTYSIEFWATYEDSAGENFATDSALVDLPLQPDHTYEPLLVMSGTGSHSGMLKEGDVINVHLNLFNAGNVDVDLKYLAVTPVGRDALDDRSGWLSMGKYWLAENETLGFPYGIVVTDADMMDGAAVRTFQVCYTWDDQEMMTNTVHMEFPVEDQEAKLTLSCAPGSGAGCGLGDSVSGILTITNDGSIPLYFSHMHLGGYEGSGDPEANDQFVGESGLSDSLLAPGESIAITEITNVVAADLMKGHVARDIKASAYYFIQDSIERAYVESNWAVLLVYLSPQDEAHLSIEKTITSHSLDPMGYALGEKIDYSLTVKNVSQEVLADVKVYDALATNNDIHLEAFPLMQPQESHSWTYSHVVNKDDVLMGHVFNEAYADYITEKDGNQGQVSSGWVIADVLPTDDKVNVSVVKSVSGGPDNGSYYVPGETIHYVFTITNLSNDSIYNCVLTDPLFASESSGSVLVSGGSLGPGESAQVTASYTVTEADAVNGYVMNQAVLSVLYNRETFYIPSNSVLVPAGYPRLSVSIVKTETSIPQVDPHGYTLGEKITYGITVTNNSNMDIYDVHVYDTLKSGDGIVGTVPSLKPGQSYNVTDFYHIVDENDMKTTEVVNYALVDFGFGEGFTHPPVISNPVISPLVSDNDDEDRFPLPGDSCIRTLTAYGADTAEYTLAFCQEHQAVEQSASALIAAAQTEEEKLAAWKQAEQLWKDAVDAMYKTYLMNSSSEHKTTVILDRIAFNQYISTYEAALRDAMKLSEQEVCQRICTLLMSRVVDMCYAAHHAPETRPDSLLSESALRLVSVSSAENCGLNLYAGNADAPLHLHSRLCREHAPLLESLQTGLANAETQDDLTDLFSGGEIRCRNAYSSLVTALGRSLPRTEQRKLVMLSTVMASYLDAESDLWMILYPEKPEIVAEILYREALELVIDLDTK